MRKLNSLMLLFLFLIALYMPVNAMGRTSEYKSDPTESSRKYKLVINAVEEELNNDPELIKHKGEMGYCHVYWQKKKMLLKEQYNIKWRSPAEMNPRIIFD